MLKNDVNIGQPFHYTLINLSEFREILLVYKGMDTSGFKKCKI
jgi:hypothetical protein